MEQTLVESVSRDLVPLGALGSTSDSVRTRDPTEKEGTLTVISTSSVSPSIVFHLLKGSNSPLLSFSSRSPTTPRSLVSGLSSSLPLRRPRCSCLQRSIYGNTVAKTSLFF